MSRALKATILALVGACLLAVALEACGPTIEYCRFRVRGKAYHRAVAEACDRLIIEHRADAPFKASGRAIAFLPPVLDRLGPSFVIVDTNCVSLLVGGGGDAYHVIWRSSEADPKQWRLSVSRGDSPAKVMLSVTKSE